MSVEAAAPIAELAAGLDLIDEHALHNGTETRAREIELATVLHALSDPVRLQILAGLADGDEHSCGSFALPVTKSTCSHHFRVLREAGVISTRIVGKARLNQLRRDELDRRFPGLIDAVLGAQTA